MGALVLAIAALLLWYAPNWDGHESVSDPKEREELTIASWDMVLKVLQTLGGLGFIATAYLAWRNFQITEDRQVSERFGQAVKMLADEQIEVRLGGIYLLERIAKDSKEDHPVVMEVLTSFIREKARFENPQTSSIPQDIQSALTVIGRRKTDYDVQRLDLSRTRLQEAFLVRADLQKAYLEGVDLQEATLVGAKLQEAYLEGAKLQGAYLMEAKLQGAYLWRTDLQKANLGRAKRRCCMKGAWIR
ncbi:MAG: pentapeptide repeat-containing protein [Cyanobacteria bacterium J06638_22]